MLSHLQSCLSVHHRHPPNSNTKLHQRWSIGRTENTIICSRPIPSCQMPTVFGCYSLYQKWPIRLARNIIISSRSSPSHQTALKSVCCFAPAAVLRIRRKHYQLPSPLSCQTPADFGHSLASSVARPARRNIIVGNVLRNCASETGLGGSRQWSIAPVQRIYIHI